MGSLLLQEAWLNYQGKNGEKKSEHVVATDREEDYTVPNEMRVIYDFEKVYIFSAITPKVYWFSVITLALEFKRYAGLV